jgi:hypothetical protein
MHATVGVGKAFQVNARHVVVVALKWRYGRFGFHRLSIEKSPLEHFTAIL